jgi:hypothetical protein
VFLIDFQVFGTVKACSALQSCSFMKIQLDNAAATDHQLLLSITPAVF